MAARTEESVWSTTFGRSLTVYQFLPFSLRVRFSWTDRARVIHELRARLGETFDIASHTFGELGLRDLPETYRRRHSGWIRIVPPPAYADSIERRRRAILEASVRRCPRPTGRPIVEILLASSGLGVIRLIHDVEWETCEDLRALHASQAIFVQSYFKDGSRDRSLADDLLPLLDPILKSVLVLPGASADPRHQLSGRYALTWPMVDFFVGLIVCAARPDAPASPRWSDLLASEEVACITDHVSSLTAEHVLNCGALLVVGWDESLLAFAGPTSPHRNNEIRNAVQFFTLGTIHWMGLYDTDQLLYEALPHLFRAGQSYTKLQLIRGVLAHLAELQHESKVAYLAEHQDNQKLLSRMFGSWETENLIVNLERKSTTLSGIVDRLNDEKLREVGVFFTVLSLIGIISNLGQHRQWDTAGWVWSGVAVIVALCGWLVLRRAGRR